MKDLERQNDPIWKALSDATRRAILDVLAERPQTTGEIVARFDELCRTNVMKHLDVLVEANLVIIRREGRTRWNYLNPVPIQHVCDRWVSKHVSRMASSLSRLKHHVEERTGIHAANVSAGTSGQGSTGNSKSSIGKKTFKSNKAKQ